MMGSMNGIVNRELDEDTVTSLRIFRRVGRSMKQELFMSIEEVIKAWKSDEGVPETHLPVSPIGYELEEWELTEEDLQLTRAWWTNTQIAFPYLVTEDGSRPPQQA